MRVIWSPAAVQDVSRIYDYISLFNPNAAQKLASRLFEAAGQLERFPFSGRISGPVGERELAVVRPYILVYEVQPDLVRVLRVWHGAQDRSFRP
ncbi:MAG TPA: type II toxin-antitoxin system RelE/ParE family toxin [Azospirillum sp.]|nr:type II toxin-antitoxin system RelE/ParE family toxin [Azospirillum sp.]